MSNYRVRVPHEYVEGADLFLTWSLHGSLSYSRYSAPTGVTAGQAFVHMDRFLDQASVGPTWLKQDDVAKLVVDALHYAQDTLKHFTLHAYVVMSNHVHVLVTPHVAPPKFLQSVKGFTAREANKLLDRTGEPFWHSESHDHSVRNDEEFGKIRNYIEQNPVKAGLVAQAEDYRWSSAFKPAAQAL